MNQPPPTRESLDRLILRVGGFSLYASGRYAIGSLILLIVSLLFYRFVDYPYIKFLLLTLGGCWLIFWLLSRLLFLWVAVRYTGDELDISIKNWQKISDALSGFGIVLLLTGLLLGFVWPGRITGALLPAGLLVLWHAQLLWRKKNLQKQDALSAEEEGA